MNKEVERLKEILKEINNKKETKSESVLIHGDSDHIEIKGILPEIMGMLTRIMQAIHKETGADKDLFEKAVKLAFMDDDGIENELKKELNKLFDELRGILDE